VSEQAASRAKAEKVDIKSARSGIAVLANIAAVRKAFCVLQNRPFVHLAFPAAYDCFCGHAKMVRTAEKLAEADY